MSLWMICNHSHQTMIKKQKEMEFRFYLENKEENSKTLLPDTAVNRAKIEWEGSERRRSRKVTIYILWGESGFI